MEPDIQPQKFSSSCAGLTNLASLEVELPCTQQPKLTLQATRHLAGLTALQELTLSDSFDKLPCKKGALQPLAHLSALRRLNLRGVALPSLSYLAPLKRLQLEQLVLKGCLSKAQRSQLPPGLVVPGAEYLDVNLIALFGS